MWRHMRSAVRYWLAEHPTVARFRWDHNTWGSTWPFLGSAITGYLLLILALRVGMAARRKAVPLGPIPAIHSMCVVASSVVVLAGSVAATAVEMEETAWIWHRTRRPGGVLAWAMCFPLGLRPAGRVFFWSYVFYLTRFHQLLDTVMWLLSKRPLTLLHVLHHVSALCACFAWLEFSQSLQIVAIIITTLLCAVRHSYLFLLFCFRRRTINHNNGTDTGHGNGNGNGNGAVVSASSSCCVCCCRCSWWSSAMMIMNWEIVHCALTIAANAVLLKLHLFSREGCNGMGAWAFNAVSNGALLFLFIRKSKSKSKSKSKANTKSKSKSKSTCTCTSTSKNNSSRSTNNHKKKRSHSRSNAPDP